MLVTYSTWVVSRSQSGVWVHGESLYGADLYEEICMGKEVGEGSVLLVLRGMAATRCFQ